MARTQGLDRAIGRVVGRDRPTDQDAADVPERRRPTASARRLRVHQMTTEGRDMAEDVADMTDDVSKQAAEVPEMRADAQGADSGEGSDGDDAAEGFPGGPRDPSVLTSFAEHVAHAVRTPVQGTGMLGSQMRPSGIGAHQQRPVQSSLRPPPPSAPNNQPAGSQSFQGHGLMRSSSVGSPATPSPSSSLSMQSLNQPWLSSGPQGKPPLPSAAYRQQLNPQSMQQRPHIPLQQQSTPTPLLANQSQEHFGQQVLPPRAPLHVPHQPQIMRVHGPGNQKPSSLVAAQSSAAQPGTRSRLTNTDTDESSNSILSKRSIHELVNQVDPLEKLEPEVADILVDIAENFLESTTSDIHKERLTVIKKSMAATEAAHGKGSAGQASGSAKGNQGKTPLNIIGLPNLKNL
ncbi:hypothetical protein glysoja_038741 [Glycine soja]|uniref:Transcription initiation factor TFIID subunit 12 domain-containing protein n=1 Tax=Glycine soja TaxID=3848 RepID=A0A0B2Q0J0_GLYSO|nr:hypothetical protein glysoja_038741 [Glycine soja]